MQKLIKIQCDMNELFQSEIIGVWIHDWCFPRALSHIMLGLGGKPLNQSCRWAVTVFMQVFLRVFDKSCYCSLSEPPLYLLIASMEAWLLQVVLHLCQKLKMRFVHNWCLCSIFTARFPPWTNHTGECSSQTIGNFDTSPIARRCSDACCWWLIWKLVILRTWKYMQ